MHIKKPVINVYETNAEKELLKEVLAGIEEEGALYEVYRIDEAEVEVLAYAAASQSLLETGIGLNGEFVCVNITKMPVYMPLLKYSTYNRANLRLAGSNAARFVKGIPFKYINE